ncbi:MAG: hypothetical protein ABIH85_06735 [Candidatus Omnitrophota bacterium]
MKINLGKREKTLISVVAVVVIIFLMERFVITPFWEKIETIRIQIQADKEKLERLRYLNSQKDCISEAFKKLEPYIEVGSLGDASIPIIMKKIEEMAKECDINLQKMKPEATEAKSGVDYNIKKLTLSVDGSTENIIKFLYQLEGSAYPLRVNKMDFKVKDRETNLMTADFDVYFIYFGKK